jgi:parallel beta-helix repeat protein
MGIRLDYVALTDITASYNTVSDNTVSSNGMDGLYVGFGCVNNTISNNTCLSNNTLGEYHYDISIYASPNTLEGNAYGTIYIY